MNQLLILLQELLPVLGGIAHQPQIATLAEKLIQIGEAEISRRTSANPSETRESILAEAAKTWDEAIKGADDLAKMGHK